MTEPTEVPWWAWALVYALVFLIFVMVHPFVGIMTVVSSAVTACLVIPLMRSSWGWWTLFVLFCALAVAWLWHLALLIAAYWVYSLPETLRVDLESATVAMVFFGALLVAMWAGRPWKRKAPRSPEPDEQIVIHGGGSR